LRAQLIPQARALTRLAAGLVRRPADLLQLPTLASGYNAALRTLRAVAAAIGPNLLALQGASTPAQATLSAGMPGRWNQIVTIMVTGATGFVGRGCRTAARCLRTHRARPRSSGQRIVGTSKPFP